MTRLMPQWFPEVWTQLPLPQLGDSDDEGLGGLDRWSFAIVGLEVNGRLRLPATDSDWDPRVLLSLETSMEHGNEEWCAVEAAEVSR